MDAPHFIAPLEVELHLDRTTLVVRPATVGQIGRLLATSVPAVRAIVSVRDIIAQRQPAGDADADVPLTEQDVIDIYAAVAPYPDDLVRMVSILSGLKVDDVGALLPDRFVYLFAVLMQVNADFFSRAVPVFGAAKQALAEAGVLASGNAPSGG